MEPRDQQANERQGCGPAAQRRDKPHQRKHIYQQRQAQRNLLQHRNKPKRGADGCQHQHHQPLVQVEPYKFILPPFGAGEN